MITVAYVAPVEKTLVGWTAHLPEFDDMWVSAQNLDDLYFAVRGVLMARQECGYHMPPSTSNDRFCEFLGEDGQNSLLITWQYQKQRAEQK